jgi:hypothetical protein
MGVDASPLGRVVESPALLFDRAALERLADRLREGYANAQPFPHAVLDHFLPEEAAARLVGEFPPVDEFVRDGTEGGNKLGKFNSAQRTPLGTFTRGLLAQLSCSPFTDFLERLSGVSGLVPEPRGVNSALRHFVRGGRLAVHADFSRTWGLGLERRVNLILYLNRHWPVEYGGALELWDRKMAACVKSIPPVFNRAIVFNPSSDAYHGFPDPLRCPEGESRKSLQLYYYAAPRVGVQLHSTIWRRRPVRWLVGRLRRRVVGLWSGEPPAKRVEPARVRGTRAGVE